MDENLRQDLRSKEELDAAKAEEHGVFEIDIPARSATPKDLVDWAESLLCNSLPMANCEQKEWEMMIRKWRDMKHELYPDGAWVAQDREAFAKSPFHEVSDNTLQTMETQEVAESVYALTDLIERFKEELTRRSNVKSSSEVDSYINTMLGDSGSQAQTFNHDEDEEDDDQSSTPS